MNFTNPDPALGEMRSEWTAEDPNPHPFLSDYNVRKALSMAIDRDGDHGGRLRRYGPADLQHYACPGLSGLDGQRGLLWFRISKAPRRCWKKPVG